MKPNLRTFAILGAIGCVLGGLLGELLIPRPAAVETPTQSGAIALVIDASGSMDDFGKLNEVKRAAQGFVERQNLSTTQIAVIGFGSSAHLESPLSRDRSTLLQAIRGIEDGGGTMMHDGLEVGLEALSRAEMGARSILLFTDGVPGSTKMSEGEASRLAQGVAERIRGQGVRLVAVGTEDANTGFLARLTGSRSLVFSTTAGRFDEAFRQAERAIRQIFGDGPPVSPGRALWEALARGGLMALGLGLLLLLGQNLLTLRGRWFRDVSWVPLSAGVLGGLAAFVGQTLLLAAGSGRGLGWTILGAGAGLFLGLADRSRAKAIRGALGGAVGGLLGGLVFELLLSTGSNAVARLFGFAILGAFVGLMVQWAQQVFKSAWLVGTTTGPYEGKEYILAKPAVTVGRSDGNDIGLYRERDLPLKAGVMRLEQGNWVWQGETIMVNGQAVKEKVLNSGDRLRFGATEFLFRVKGGLPAEAREAWALHGNNQTYDLPFPLKKATIGSGRGCAVIVKGLEPTHAEIVLNEEGLELVVLAAPAALNGQALNQGQRVKVKPGDLLRLGKEEFALARQRN
jgi:Ca-activated chloride channel family protein